MKYTQYGKTGKQVSVVGFGGMRFDAAKSNEENAELVRYAASCGITYFDTAPGYCRDTSEDIFGIAFRDMPPDSLVSTKGMPTNFDTADKARDAVRRSLDRLGVDKIHFYHVWCLRKMAHYELAVQSGGQYEGLLRCQQEGLIDHICVSTHQRGPQVAQILANAEFEGVLLGVNILNFPYRWDGLMAARERGCGVVAMNPLAGGAIPRHAEQLPFLARNGETPVEAALRFNIGCPAITITLCGFTTREHVDAACRVADTAEAMTDAEVASLRTHLGSNLDQVCTGCGYCRDCPRQIPIPGYMQFYNDKVMFGKSDEGMRKSLNGARNWGMIVERPADAGACIECGKCEEACTQHLPIVERLSEIAAWEAAL